MSAISPNQSPGRIVSIFSLFDRQHLQTHPIYPPQQRRTCLLDHLPHILPPPLQAARTQQSTKQIQFTPRFVFLEYLGRTVFLSTLLLFSCQHVLRKLSINVIGFNVRVRVRVHYYKM